MLFLQQIYIKILMKSFFRLEEYKVLGYRILLVYFFYFIARILFYAYNASIVEVDTIIEFLKLFIQVEIATIVSELTSIEVD